MSLSWSVFLSYAQTRSHSEAAQISSGLRAVLRPALSQPEMESRGAKLCA